MSWYFSIYCTFYPKQSPSITIYFGQMGESQRHDKEEPTSDVGKQFDTSVWQSPLTPTRLFTPNCLAVPHENKFILNMIYISCSWKLLRKNITHQNNSNSCENLKKKWWQENANLLKSMWSVDVFHLVTTKRKRDKEKCKVFDDKTSLILTRYLFS